MRNALGASPIAAGARGLVRHRRRDGRAARRRRCRRSCWPGAVPRRWSRWPTGSGPPGPRWRSRPWDATDVGRPRRRGQGGLGRAAGRGPDDVDCVVLAAGVLGDQDHLVDDPAAAAELTTANYTGAGVDPAARSPAAAGAGPRHASSSSARWPASGSAGRTSSTARPRPALDGFAQGLGDSSPAPGVGVLVVRPGFVHTSMTEGQRGAPAVHHPRGGRRGRDRRPWPPGKQIGVGARDVPLRDGRASATCPGRCGASCRPGCEAPVADELRVQLRPGAPDRRAGGRGPGVGRTVHVAGSAGPRQAGPAQAVGQERAGVRGAGRRRRARQPRVGVRRHSSPSSRFCLAAAGHLLHQRRPRRRGRPPAPQEAQAAASPRASCRCPWPTSAGPLLLAGAAGASPPRSTATWLLHGGSATWRSPPPTRRSSSRWPWSTSWPWPPGSCCGPWAAPPPPRSRSPTGSSS